jgi:hypothetical protein
MKSNKRKKKKKKMKITKIRLSPLSSSDFFYKCYKFEIKGHRGRVDDENGTVYLPKRLS